MTDAVRDAYDARAKEYADLNLGDLDRFPLDREWLGAFAKLVFPGAGVVADVGCGPGHIVNHLSALGVTAIGYDISSAMIGIARRTFPGSKFQVGDLTFINISDGSLAGIVSPLLAHPYGPGTTHRCL